MFKTITPKWHTADNSDRKSALAVSSGKCPWEDWRTASCFPAVLGLQNRGVELFTRQETSNSKWRLHHAKQKANMMPNYSITVNIPLWKRKHTFAPLLTTECRKHDINGSKTHQPTRKLWKLLAERPPWGSQGFPGHLHRRNSPLWYLWMVDGHRNPAPHAMDLSL